MPDQLLGKEHYDLVAQNTSPRVARRAVLLGLVTFVAVCLSFLGVFVWIVSTYVMTPAVAFIATFSAGHVPHLSVGVGNLLASLALTVLLFVVAGYLARRWFRRWETRLINGLGGSLDTRYRVLVRRVDHIQRNSADLKTTRNAIRSLMVRVQRLESRPDLGAFFDSGGGGSTPPALVGVHVPLAQELRGEDDITPVGDPPPEPDDEPPR
jgi:hypothetical protein